MSAKFSRATPAPPRRAVASFTSYAEAERAVDLLADRHFPVEHVAIVGRDLRYVEQVTGRMTYPRAALSGALSGALIGFLIGWLFGVFNWFDPVVATLWLMIDGLWFGALLGAVFGVLLHALQGGRRDFAATGYTTADHYDVVVDEEFADDAQRLLEASGTSAAPPTPGVNTTADTSAERQPG
jgi:uncharacterized membrane protein